MTVSLKPTDIVTMRMHALLLADKATSTMSYSDPANVVEHLLAMQGQDFDAARWALAIRAGTPDAPASPATVAAAFNSGKIVRSWPMRGTVHFVRAEDINWLQQLCNPGVLKGWPKRREYLELDLKDYERVREVTLDALSGGKSLPRDQLVKLWGSSGIEIKQGWSYHLVWALCQHGETVFGPMNESGDLELVLAREWIKNQKQYDKDEALAEIWVRYLTGHGPATVQDLAWWSSLPVRALKAGLKTAADRVTEVEADGVSYFVLPQQLETYSPSKAPKSLLALTPFDEHLLGYKDRSLFVNPEHARKTMTINGIAQPTIVRNGRVVATWKVRDGSLALLEGEKVGKADLAQSENRLTDARTWLGRV